MAHKIKISMPNLPIGGSDVSFSIVNQNERIGTLRVSKGNIEWRPANKQHGYSMNWTRFGDHMMENGRKRKTKLRDAPRRMHKRGSTD